MSCVSLANLPTPQISRFNYTTYDKLSAWLSLFGEVSYIDYEPNSSRAIITFKSDPNPEIYKTLFMGHTISVKNCNEPNYIKETIPPI